MLQLQEKEEFLTFPQTDVDCLCSKDPKLAEAITQIGPIKRKVIPDPFTGLLHAILSQQISSKARDSIWQKLLSAYAPISATGFACLAPEQLRICGISNRKAQYMLGVANAFASGAIDSKKLEAMGDNELVMRLKELPGIGKWTAEMLLIFTFKRPNILSFDDLGIRRAICKLYEFKTFTFNRYVDCFRRYSPTATLASLYLWEYAAIAK